MRPVGVWVEGEGVSAGTRIPGELIAALQQHPPLPFMLADRMELWLLDKQRGLPLALLASELPSRYRHERIKPEWHPFTLSHTGFHSAALARREERNGNIRQPASRLAGPHGQQRRPTLSGRPMVSSSA